MRTHRTPITVAPRTTQATTARSVMGPGAQLPGPSGRIVDLAMGARVNRASSPARLAGAVARGRHRGRG